MTGIKGGKGLHGPDKQQDALRNGGSNAHGKGDPSKVTPPRQGVPDDTLRRDDPDLPEGLSRKRMGPLNKDTGRGG